MERIKNLYKTESQIVSDAFDRVVAEIHIRKQQDGIKSFVFCGCEPGVGATTMAINLAVSMADAGWKVLLVDADLRKRAEHQRLNDGTEIGLCEYLSGKADIDIVTYATNYDTLFYLGSGNGDAGAVSLLCSNRMKELLSIATEKYDYVIVDVPSMASAVDASILASQVNAVVLVTSQGNGQMKYISEAKDKLTKAGANILGIIVNRVSKSEYKKSVRDYDYFKKQKYKKKKMKTKAGNSVQKEA